MDATEKPLYQQDYINKLEFLIQRNANGELSFIGIMNEVAALTQKTFDSLGK